MKIANTKVMCSSSPHLEQLRMVLNAKRCVKNLRILDANIGFSFEKKNHVHCTKVENGNVQQNEALTVQDSVDARIDVPCFD